MSIRQVGGVDLWVEQGGTSNGPTLLLMHGLSGTGGVWNGLRPLLEKYWPGSWVILDLRATEDPPIAKIMALRATQPTWPNWFKDRTNSISLAIPWVGWSVF